MIILIILLIITTTLFVIIDVMLEKLKSSFYDLEIRMLQNEKRLGIIENKLKKLNK